MPRRRSSKARVPLFFFYRELIDKEGFPEIEGLVCEKGIWWYPARGLKSPDLRDDTALVHIWRRWSRLCSELLTRRYRDMEAFRRAWYRRR